ncbi:unnamed protein product, partial [Ixodes hexagonus]
ASNFTLPSWHSSLVNSPSSIYQESRFSTTTCTNITGIDLLENDTSGPGRWRHP